jgi:hypothetical protein
MTVRKNFIAGARCPHCQVEDRLLWCRENGKDWLECTACGYTATEPAAPEHPNEPPPSEEQIVQLQPARKP